MILVDLTHTSHTTARTGIQRVCRSLQSALAAQTPVTPVCHDPFQRVWRPLEDWERETLADETPSAHRGARWPLHAKVGGRTRRWLRRTPPALPDAAGAIVPEVFSAATAHALPELFTRVAGPRIAVFHDAIALKYPELSPSKTVARFPAYMMELLAFDGIAAVSADSRDSLLDYWRWARVPQPPPVIALPLALDPCPEVALPGAPADDEPEVLCIGTLEGRKNHIALLDAAERLWSSGTRFRLRLIGSAHPQTGRAAVQRVRSLIEAGRPLRYDGPVTDADLHAAYRGCAFTVYPSLIEGFGLPVLESLQHGKPCICSSKGALGESAAGGGCLTLPTVDADALAGAVGWLLGHPAEVERLAEAARARTFRPWSAYASEILAWMDELR